jgi:hypothetical protein
VSPDRPVLPLWRYDSTVLQYPGAFGKMVIRRTRTTCARLRPVYAAVVVAVLMLCAPGPMAAAAQDGEPVLTVSYEAFPIADLNSSSTLPVNGDPGVGEALRVREKRLAVDFSAPIIRGSARTALLVLFGYCRYDLDLEHWNEPQAGRRVKSPQTFEAGASLRRLMSNGWRMRVDLVPGLHSDFEGEVGIDDLGLRAALVFQRSPSDRLSLAFGFGYSPSTGRGLPMPVVGLAWQAADAVLVDLMLPEHASVWYTPNPIVRFGLSAALNGGSYRGNPDLYRMASPETRIAAGTFGPSLRVQVTDRFGLRIDSGVTFFRRIDLYDGGEERWSLDPKRTAFGRITAEIWH